MYNLPMRIFEFFGSRSKKTKICFLTLWSTAFTIPLFLKTGTNIVTNTFLEGSFRYWHGLDPYMAAGIGADIYHYPPFFAFIYGPFLFFNPILHAVLWAAINAFFFWAGVISFTTSVRWKNGWYGLGLVLMAMELDISLRYQQSNALMIGLTLLALSALKDAKEVQAAIWLGVGASIKIFPAFIALYFFPKYRKMGLVFILICLLLLFLPAIPLGMERYLNIIESLYRSLVFDTAHGHFRRMLDIRAFVTHLGFPTIGAVLSKSILLITLLLCLIMHRFEKKDFPWGSFSALFFSGFLLFSNRTESPTFILFAAFYPILLADAEVLAQRIFLFSCFFLSTFLYTSLWPNAFYTFFQDFWTSKTVATFAVWTYLSVNTLLEFKMRRTELATA